MSLIDPNLQLPLTLSIYRHSSLIPTHLPFWFKPSCVPLVNLPAKIQGVIAPETISQWSTKSETLSLAPTYQPYIHPSYSRTLLLLPSLAHDSESNLEITILEVLIFNLLPNSLYSLWRTSFLLIPMSFLVKVSVTSGCSHSSLIMFCHHSKTLTLAPGGQHTMLVSQLQPQNILSAPLTNISPITITQQAFTLPRCASEPGLDP